MEREQLLNILAQEHRKIAHEYFELCKEYGQKKAVMRALVASHIKQILEVKKGVGMEMAEVLLISDKPEFAEDYARTFELEYLLRGYEEILNQIKSEQIKEQSIMKHYGEHDGYVKPRKMEKSR